MGVKATVIDIKTGLEELTNDFRFTWCKEEGEPVARTVVPMTYQGASFFLRLFPPRSRSFSSLGCCEWHDADDDLVCAEAMWWIEGKRALDLGAEIRGIRQRQRQW